jgi:hypothetical protein
MVRSRETARVFENKYNLENCLQDLVEISERITTFYIVEKYFPK